MGTVIDLRLRTDAPPGEDVRTLRLEGLVVARRHFGSELGYDRRDEGRPSLLCWIVRRLHRSDRYVPWELVRDFSGGVVEIDAEKADLSAVPPLPAAS